MNEIQVLITRQSDGNAALVAVKLDDLKWSTTIPGGFGSCSLFLPGDPTQVIGDTGVEYLADIKILGPGGSFIGAPFSGQSDVLFEGRIEDISRSVTPGHVGVGVECLGYQVLTNEPYRNAPIRSDSEGRFQQGPVTTPNVRPEWARLSAGQGQSLDDNLASSGDARGLVFRVAPSQPASVAWQNQAVEQFPYPGTRVKFDLSANCGPGGGSVAFNLRAIASYLASFSSVVDVFPSNITPTTNSIAMPSGFRNGMQFIIYVTAAEAGLSSYAWLLVNKPRVLAPRGPSALDDEPVYGHELVQDVVFNSLLTKDYSQVDTDTSYQFSSADFSGPGQTLRAALDYITAYYSRFWAVWENKTLYWNSSVLNGGPTWTVSAKQGVTFDLDPSIAETARSVRVAYRDVQGVNREVTFDDPRLDNVFAIAGASKQAQITLPVVANSSAAQQIATTYFPDHSYEVLRGTLTVPAQMMLANNKQGGGALPAYKMRAGESVRLLDAASAKDYFSSAYDRKTILFIRTTSVDWEAQTVTLEVDNTRDSLTTLLARVSASVQSRFPGT